MIDFQVCVCVCVEDHEMMMGSITRKMGQTMKSISAMAQNQILRIVSVITTKKHIRSKNIFETWVFVDV